MKRPSARQRGYDSRWDRAAAAFKRANPLCLGCQAIGRVSATEVVDHVIPHRGDQVLFWDAENNWQSACAWHHNAIKPQLEALWDAGAIKPASLRLDSPEAIQRTRATPQRIMIGVDGWPV